ncbi:MAG: hypothetical protein ACO3P5_03165 [Steroidobacteraceae bacterium]
MANLEAGKQRWSLRCGQLIQKAQALSVDLEHERVLLAATEIGTAGAQRTH